jgi:hypothetical protein
MLKNLLKDNVRTTFGFDVEKIKEGKKIKIKYSHSIWPDKIRWVMQCTPDKIWLMDEDGICHMSQDIYTADQYLDECIEFEIIE